MVGKSAAFALARSASDLVEELAASRRELQRQQAELAVRAAILKTDADRDRMTERLEKTLADAAAACACDAAAFYMLDDETQYLKTRFVFGLAPDRLQQPPRTLRGSRGDLEAMVQGVVVIDDLTNDLADTWNWPRTLRCRDLRRRAVRRRSDRDPLAVPAGGGPLQPARHRRDPVGR